MIKLLINTILNIIYSMFRLLFFPKFCSVNENKYAKISFQQFT